MNWNRLLSGLIAVIYIAVEYAKSGSGSACGIAIAVVFPLACILYGEEMGTYLGPTPRGAMTETSPGWMVCAGGWFILLLLPAVEIVRHFTS